MDEAAPPLAVDDALVADLLRAAFNSAPDGIVVVTNDGLLLTCNPAFIALWDFPPDMLARRNALEMRRHTARLMQDPDAYLASPRRLVTATSPQVFDQVLLIDGRVFERHVTPLRVPGVGDAIAVRWRDITARHRAEQALAASQQRLAALWAHAHNAILLADDSGRCIDVNPAACTLLGLERETLLQRHVADLVVSSPDSHEQAWSQFLVAGKASGQMQLRRGDGALLFVQFDAVAGMQPGVHLVVLSDLTATLRQQQRQQELAALMDLAMLDADLVFWEADLRTGQLSSANGHWSAMLGYDRDEVPGTLDAWDALVHPDDAVGRLLVWEAHLLSNTSIFECEFRLRHKLGHWVWMQVRGRVVERAPDGEALRVAGLRMNITGRKQTEARLEGLAHTDALTGLNNRRRFTDLATSALAHAQRHGHPVALLMIDLDHFKSINDRLGHAGGDAVLRSFASTAQTVMRQDDIFGRVGGEEFAALLPQTTPDGARVLAERLRRHITQQPAAVGEVSLRYSVSIGVATWMPGDADMAGIDRLMVAADRALYAAKAQGRDRVVHAEAL